LNSFSFSLLTLHSQLDEKIIAHSSSLLTTASVLLSPLIFVQLPLFVALTRHAPICLLAQVLSNLVYVPTRQLLTPTIKGYALCVKITQEEYEQGKNECK